MNAFYRCESLLATPDISYLVPVRIGMVRRGVPEERAEIYLPAADDISRFRIDRSAVGPLQSVCRCNNSNRDAYYSSTGGELNANRMVIGYVKNGRYSHSVGAAFGFGFVTLKSLLGMIKQSSVVMSDDLPTGGNVDHSGLIALTRAVNSRQYRYVFLNVLL